jgi:sigma-B regulation protein RsbU (phosphoserine phosphatase)
MSAIYATIDRNGLLTVVNAGHPQMLILKNSGELISLKTGALLLGLFENDVLELEKETFQLSPGEKFFLLTDGLLERTNPEGEMYGAKRFHDVLVRNKDKKIKGILECIALEIQDFSKGCPPDDDISLVAIEYKGSK